MAEAFEIERKLLAELTFGTKVLKPDDELLRDDVLSYAHGKPLPLPFTTEFSSFDLMRHLIPSDKNQTEWQEDTDQIRQEKIGALNLLAMIRKHDGNIFKSTPKNRRPKFDKYFGEHAHQVLEELATQYDVLEECRAKGIMGLLEIRSVRVFTGAYLSLGYALTREGKAEDLGNWHDLRHAVSASAAEAFVTQDEQLAFNLHRIGIVDFQVFNLQSFLQKVLSAFAH